MADYQKQASDFLKKHGISFSKQFKGFKCPMWCNDNKHIHGNKYLITFTRTIRGKRKQFSVNFWNSYNDRINKKSPVPYDVLTAIQKYEVGTLEDFVDEFGYELWVEDDYGRMKKDPKVVKTYEAVKAEYKKVKGFFTPAEMEELWEIQ